LDGDVKRKGRGRRSWLAEKGGGGDAQEVLEAVRRLIVVVVGGDHAALDASTTLLHGSKSRIELYSRQPHRKYAVEDKQEKERKTEEVRRVSSENHRSVR
jgi:DNA-binding transcriptional regulator/RsmH inhibitor MraZ